jgi:glycosyltransferase involved in cell wall biosynthesis
VPAPLVSVLLPVRDGGATLGACLDSLARQRLADWECVLVDDGSSDATGAIAAAAAATDPRIRVMTCPRQGIVPALNEGLASCRGTFVARMDADDVMHRDRLHLQTEALARAPELAGVGCHVRIFPRRDLTPGRRAYEAWLNTMASDDDVRRDALVECPIAHPALMMRRTVLGAFGYRSMPWPEDYDLVLRMLDRGERLGVVPRRLIGWRDGAGRLSRTDPRYGLDRFPACKAHFLARGYLAGSESFVLWGYGDTGRTLARALLDVGRRPSRIVEVHPRRIGQRIGGVPVVGLDALPGVRGEPLVVSVAGPGPRAQIRAHLAALGFAEGRDFVTAA